VAFPYANLVVRGTRPANTSLPFGAIALLFLLIACQPIAARLSRRLVLVRQELIIVFTMILLASSVPTWGLVGQLLPVLTGAQYYASPENRWGDTILPYVPDWLVPQAPAAARQFYEGLERGAALPWAAWAVPLAAWSVLVAAYFLTTICFMLLLRRPWVEQERLIYPLMRLPLAMTEQVTAARPLAPLMRNALLWLGVAAVLVPTCLNGLHHYVPTVPFLHLRHDYRASLGQETLLFRCWLNFAVVGFTYVVSTDLAFSLWFFALFTVIQTPLMRLYGLGLGAKEIYCAGSPAVSNQAMGAMLLLVGTTLWTARRHLTRMFRAALGLDGSGLEAEPASPPFALWGAVGGTLVMLLWLHAAGLPLLPSAVFLFAMWVTFLALTRATVQGGVPVSRAALIPQSFTVHALGSRALGAHGLTLLAYTFPWTADIRVFLMPFFAHALRLWDELRPRPRALLPAAALALLIAALGSVPLTLYLAYHRGGVALSSWLFRGNPLSAFRYTANLLEHPAPASLARSGFLGLGAGVMWLLTMAHHNLAWWPFHPLGFAIAPTQPVQDLWFPILIGWIFKAVTLRYGGFRLYHRLLPLFLGLILGQCLGSALWVAIDALAGHTGNLIYVY